MSREFLIEALKPENEGRVFKLASSTESSFDSMKFHNGQLYFKTASEPTWWTPSRISINQFFSFRWRWLDEAKPEYDHIVDGSKKVEPLCGTCGGQGGYSKGKYIQPCESCITAGRLDAVVRTLEQIAFNVQQENIKLAERVEKLEKEQKVTQDTQQLKLACPSCGGRRGFNVNNVFTKCTQCNGSGVQ